MTGLRYCPDCGAFWDSRIYTTLNQTYKVMKERCLTCYEEKRRREKFVIQKIQAEGEAWAEAHRREQAALTPEQRRVQAAQAEADMKELW